MEHNLKVTIITVVRNAEHTISKCLSSILEQTYLNIELIVIDGASSDATLGVIQRIKADNMNVFSEKDLGVYDALNKGLTRATGDVVGLLHGDDYLAHKNVIANVVKNFVIGNSSILIGRLSYFHLKDIQRVVRHYYPFSFKKWMFRFGIAPPHPTFYAKKELFTQYGNYRTDVEIAGDFDLMLRFLLIHRIPYKCIDEVWVMMGMGGKSTQGLKSIFKNNSDILKVCKSHQLYTNYAFIYLKYFVKALGLLAK